MDWSQAVRALLCLELILNAVNLNLVTFSDFFYFLIGVSFFTLCFSPEATLLTAPCARWRRTGYRPAKLRRAVVCGYYEAHGFLDRCPISVKEFSWTHLHTKSSGGMKVFQLVEFLAYRWPAFKKHLWAEVSRSTILLEWRKTVNQILWFSILYSTEVQWTQTQSQWIKRRTKAIHWEGLNLPYDPTYDPISLLLLNF